MAQDTLGYSSSSRLYRWWLKAFKSGIRKSNIAKRSVFGRRTSGYFKIATLNGKVVHNSANYKKLKLLEKSKTFLIIKKRSGICSPCLKTGFSMASFR